MQDVRIQTENHKFKYRVNLIVLKNGKVLTIKMSNGTAYCLPGGHIELGEDSRTAAIREAFEELDSEVTISHELAIAENFYTDKAGLITHEHSFYYIVEPVTFDKIPLVNYTRTENDKGKIKEHYFEWLDIKKLSDVNLVPSFIKEKLAKDDLTFEHFIIK